MGLTASNNSQREVWFSGHKSFEYITHGEYIRTRRTETPEGKA